MGLFDDISASLNRGVSAASRSGKTAQLKLQMSDLMRQRRDLTAQLGANLYEATKDDPAVRAGREELYDAIAAIDEQRVQLQASVDQLKAEQEAASAAAQQLRCPACGAWVGVNDMFCSGCGMSVEDIKAQQPAHDDEPPTPGLACPDCGAPVAPGDAFCGSCGKRLGE